MNEPTSKHEYLDFLSAEFDELSIWKKTIVVTALLSFSPVILSLAPLLPLFAFPLLFVGPLEESAPPGALVHDVRQPT